MFAACKTFLELTFLSVEEQKSLGHLLFVNNSRWFLAFEKCVERTLNSYYWCVPSFVFAKISRLRLFRKTSRVLLEYHIYSENGRGKASLRELSFIRSLTFCVIDVRPIIAENWCVINEFCKRGRDEKMIFWYYSPQRKCQTKFLQFLWQKGLSLNILPVKIS